MLQGAAEEAGLRRNAFVVSLSYIPDDGRVMRQIQCLLDDGWLVTAIGIDQNLHGSKLARLANDGVTHVMLPSPLWNGREKVRTALDLLVGRVVPGVAAAIAPCTAFAIGKIVDECRARGGRSLLGRIGRADHRK